MKKIILGALLSAPMMLAACSDEPGDKVDQGRGAPTTNKEIVVEDGLKNEPNMIIDDKGNPVLNDDGTPKYEGQKPGPDYRGEMPRNFQGVWAIDQKDCEAGSGPSRVRIGAHNVVFYKAEAEVKKLEQVGAITVADMEVKAGPVETREQHKFSMDGDGITMRYDRGGQIYQYRQCP